ncbi:MAG: alpha/beta fold hydrolase [Arenibacterium sp.]
MLEWSSAPETRLSIRGLELEYACFGPAPDQAPTIVMLHEGLGCVALWRDFPAQVAEATGMGVIAYSRAGYGQSDPVDLPRPVDFITREAVEVLPEVLDQIGFQRGIFLGHSDGASIAAAHAGSIADMRVRGLILMAPHFFTEPHGLAAIAEAKQAYETGDLREKLAKYHADPDNAFYGWNEVWLREAFRDWDITDVIDYFRVPTLAIQGRDDAYGTLKQIEIIEERSYAPVDLVVLEACGHAPHQEHPDTVLAAVAEFAARLNRIEAAEVETG